MKLLFAPDSFKGSLTAIEITDILDKVTKRHFPGSETISIPVADGGEARRTRCFAQITAGSSTSP